MWWVIAWFVGFIVSNVILNRWTYSWRDTLIKRSASKEEQRAALRTGLVLSFFLSLMSWLTVVVIVLFVPEE